MKLSNIKEVNSFLAVIDSCAGNVWLTSIYGDKINMKSKISQFLAIAALLGEHGDEMEIYCDSKEDEAKVLQYFHDNPEVL